MNSDPQGISGILERCKVNRTFTYEPEEDSSQPHTRRLPPQEQLVRTVYYLFNWQGKNWKYRHEGGQLVFLVSRGDVVLHEHFIIWATADTRVFVVDSANVLEMGEALAERVMS